MAPVNIRDPRMAAALLHFAARYAHGMPATLDIALPDLVPITSEELRHIEATHQVPIPALGVWFMLPYCERTQAGVARVCFQVLRSCVSW